MQTAEEKKAIGERLATYRKMKNLSQTDFGKKLNVSRPLVAAWEKGQREILPYLDDICKVLDIDSGLLLTGVNSSNQTVCADLGLTDASVEQLKVMQEFTSHKYRAKVVIGINIDGDIVSRGVNPREFLKMINILIENPKGQTLLSLLYRYCFSRFDYCYVPGSAFPVHELHVDNLNSTEGETEYDPSLLKFATYKAIENTIEKLSLDLKGDE